MKELTDGDYRILQALAQEEKSFSELLKVVKNPTYLSERLKRLQKLGLIERDIDTRRYRLIPLTLEMLILRDWIEFLNERQKEMIDFFYRSLTLTNVSEKWRLMWELESPVTTFCYLKIRGWQELS